MSQLSPEDAAFLADYDPERFPRPSVTVDVAVLTVHEDRLRVLLVQRSARPLLGHWALPGGFVGLDESLDDAARRVLFAKAGLEDVYLEQLYTFGLPDRDPRGRVISVGYFALVDHGRLEAALEGAAGSEPARLVPLDVPWSGEAPSRKNGGARAIDAASGAPLDLAFDHDVQLTHLVTRLRGKLDYAALGFQLLPERFTLRSLQDVHEAVLGRALNKDSFRRRILASGLIASTGERESDVDHRPAELFRFVRPSSSA